MAEQPHLRPCHCCDGTGKELNPVEVGRMMREHRLSVPLTLRQAARRLGLSASYLSDLERGRRQWTAERIADYHHKLG